MKKMTFLVAGILWTFGSNAQNVGISAPNPTEKLHLRTDSTKLALRLDSKKSVQFGVNYDATIGSPANVQNFVLDTQYIDWTDLDYTKLLNSDNTRLNSPSLEIYPEIANPVRIQFSVNPSIPSNATITNITLNTEWKRFGTYAGELRIGSIYLKKASNDLILLSFGFEKITSSTDQSVTIPYQQVFNPVTPDMLNLGDVYISLVNLHSVSPGLSRLEIDKLWLEVEYSMPADGTENVFWTAGTRDGNFSIANSNNLLTKNYLYIDEVGDTHLNGLQMTKNAGAGKVLTSNDEGKAFWANLPSTTVNSLNDLIDARANVSNLFVGQYAGDSITTGQYNTGIGLYGLQDNTTGTSNTAFGYSGLASNISGSYNIAIGNQALFVNTTGSRNTASGYRALYSNTTGSQNTAYGYRALFANTTGQENNAIGAEALYSNTTGMDNTANGYQALYSNTTGNNNAAFGYQVLYGNTTGLNNTGMGFKALTSNTSGVQNTASGYRALDSNTTGNSNTGLGFNALQSNTIGEKNTATGTGALASNTEGINNTANGFQALHSNTTGEHNTAFGYGALNSSITGNYNTASGSDALKNNNGGYRNTANGASALLNNTSGDYNTANGSDALYTNSIGQYNTANGYKALMSNTEGSNNSACGYLALYNNTTGTGNSANGYASLQSNTTGYTNTASGQAALSGNTTGFHNTAVGFTAFTNGTNYSNSTGIGFDAEPDASNTVRLGNASVGTIGGFANWTNVSDRRFKTNVKEDIAGLDFIMKLRPVSYSLDMDAIAAHTGIPDSLRLLESEALKAAEIQTGFIAQEVEKAAQETGFAFHGVDVPKSETSHYGLRYAEFVVPLVKAMQEQQQEINLQQQTINKQQQEIDLLKALVQQLLNK